MNEIFSISSSFCFHTRQSDDNRNARKSKIEIEKPKKVFENEEKDKSVFGISVFNFFHFASVAGNDQNRRTV